MESESDDDLVKGVPDDDEENTENTENTDNNTENNIENTDNNGENGEENGEENGDENGDENGENQNWGEGEQIEEEEGDGEEREGEREYTNENENGEFDQNMAAFNNGNTEEGDVDVEGEGERDDEDEEDVDVDDDDDRKENGKGEDSDIDIGSGPNDKAKTKTTTTTKKETKTIINNKEPAAIFEPEYEILDFTNKGNIFHKEAFFSEWEKCITEQVDDIEEILVPIRIDLTVDNHKIQDTFVWNLKEKSLTPDAYAAMLCADLDLPNRADRLVADSIRQQLGEFRDYVPSVPSATSRPYSSSSSLSSLSSSIAHSSLPECVVPIKVDITISQVWLHDEFEWDLNNPANAPEPFARSLCQELGLSREFEASVVHAIREQLAYHAQYTVPLMQHTHTLRGPTLTADKVIRGETELLQWTPIVNNVITTRPVANAPSPFPSYGTPQGPVRHSSRLREAASQAQPYSLRGGSTNR